MKSEVITIKTEVGDKSYLITFDETIYATAQDAENARIEFEDERKQRELVVDQFRSEQYAREEEFRQWQINTPKGWIDKKMANDEEAIKIIREQDLLNTIETLKQKVEQLEKN